MLALLKDGTISPKIERQEAERLVSNDLAEKLKITQSPSKSQTMDLAISEAKASPRVRP